MARRDLLSRSRIPGDGPPNFRWRLDDYVSLSSADIKHNYQGSQPPPERSTERRLTLRCREIRLVTSNDLLRTGRASGKFCLRQYKMVHIRIVSSSPREIESWYAPQNLPVMGLTGNDAHHRFGMKHQPKERFKAAAGRQLLCPSFR